MNHDGRKGTIPPNNLFELFEKMTDNDEGEQKENQDVVGMKDIGPFLFLWCEAFQVECKTRGQEEREDEHSKLDVMVASSLIESVKDSDPEGDGPQVGMVGFEIPSAE